MSGLLGSRVGPYEVTGVLGAGGMGEVYRARDAKLNRDVALKVLPAAFATDAERLARFRREAQVLAALNHPNIGAIYGFEESDRLSALVLELVDGPTLEDRLAHGPLPAEEVMAIARQIVDALETAHERGVVHRDLKPANIKLRPDGATKVLDFGLAKALDPAVTGSTSATVSPTITSPAMTAAGMLLGTAAYMSPEQAKGREADKRSDVWAFGAVLFEMLTARRAFEGEDVADTLAAVLTKEPDWRALPAATPPALTRLLQRCLRRDRRRRLADIADARLELDEAESDGAPAVSATAMPVRAARWPLAAAIAVAALALAAALWQFLQPAQSRLAARFEVMPPPDHAFYFGTRFIALSPDGRRLAFVTGRVPGERRLWIRPLNTLTAREIAAPDGAMNPIWSPDSRSIVYTVGVAALPRMEKITLDGGPPVTLAQGVPGAWSRDGHVLFRGRGDALYRVADTGGEPVQVTVVNPDLQEAIHDASFFLPDGRRFAFVARTRDGSRKTLYLASLDSSERTKVLDGVSSVAYAEGYLLYLRGDTLMAQQFDARAGQLTGDAVPLAQNVDYQQLSGDGAFSASATGAIAYRSGDEEAASRLGWYSLDGKLLAALPAESRFTNTRRPALSPDARHLAYTAAQGFRGDVWLMDLERTSPVRFTNNEGAESPVWSQDGRRLIFTALNDRQVGDLYWRDVSSTAPPELLFSSGYDKRAHDISPDGQVLLFGTAPQGNPEIWALSMTDRKATAVVSTGFPAGNAVFSPNGRWFAYCEGDAGPDQVYVQPYPQTGLRIRVSTTFGSSPQWTHDGTAIVYAGGENKVMRVEISEAQGTLKVGTPRELFTARAMFTHRATLLDAPRERILLPFIASDRDPAVRPITVVLNWREELAALRQDAARD
jgi:Tol biopolymer transport system component